MGAWEIKVKRLKITNQKLQIKHMDVKYSKVNQVNNNVKKPEWCQVDSGYIGPSHQKLYKCLTTLLWARSSHKGKYRISTGIEEKKGNIIPNSREAKARVWG